MLQRQFYCHYTGKDGLTPRRRKQTLTFFDHIPSFGNSDAVQTPLWVEVMDDTRPVAKHYGDSPKLFMLHAELSEDVAVYVEYFFTSGMLTVINSLHDAKLNDAGQRVVAEICEAAVAELREYLDFSQFLLSHPERITPTILAAYREARPVEYELLNIAYNLHH